MSGLYIPGLSMPRKTGIVSIVLSGDGSALLCEDGAYSEIKVIPVPDHGDLIDKQYAYQNTMAMGEHTRKIILKQINALPIVIPAGKEGEG